MRDLSKRFALALCALAVAGCAAAPRPGPGAELRWWKGNLHTHSLWSDGDDYPESITDWYKRNGYDFLAISDHNTLAEGERWIPVRRDRPVADSVYRRYLARFGAGWVQQRTVRDTLQVRLRTLAEYRPLFEEPGRFLILQSEELSALFQTRPLHLNVTNVRERIEPRGGGSVREVLQNNIDAVLEQRERTGQPMIPHLNHPNFRWAVTVEDMMALEGERFFEVYNGHWDVHNEGDAVHPGTERMWDILLAERLSSGREPMYGLATDDAHHYVATGPGTASVGRGWIMVRATELTPASLIDAMERGDFYASNGVRLRDVRRDGGTLRVAIDAEPGVTYTTRFIGTRRGYARGSEPVRDTAGVAVSRRYSDEVGELLGEASGPLATYRLRGDELYVRATITSSRPKTNPYREGEMEMAWTQPWVIR